MAQIGMTPAQWVSFVLCALLIVVSAHLAWTQPTKRWEFIAYLLWFVQSFLFYLAYATYWVPAIGQYTEWGAIIRVQGYLLLLCHFTYKAYRYHGK